MPDFDDRNLISSKEVLEETAISRATLNNYIKMGIIPRPIVQKPTDGTTTIKSLGYFPESVINRIEEVKRLKKSGNSMEDIIRILSDNPILVHRDQDIESQVQPMEDIARIFSNRPISVKNEQEFNEAPARSMDKETHSKRPPQKVFKRELKLTLEDISYPSYLLNYDFEIEWINQEAENQILNQKISLIEERESRNIFKLSFNWEFHSHVQNWKDLTSFHMSFAKLKFSKTWLSKLYRGISDKEVNVLEKIYEEVQISSNQTIHDNHLSLLMKTGSTKQYRVYSIFFREGILFAFVPF